MSATHHSPERHEQTPIAPSTASQVSQTSRPTRPLDKKSTEYLVKSGLAGGVAGCAAKTVVGPLDRVKILFQASNPQFTKYAGSWTGLVDAIRDIHLQDGMRGLFRGHSATLLRIAPYAGIKFLAYEQVRARLIPTPAHETALRRLLSGALSGCASVLLTYPLEVIRVRLAFETKREGRSTLISICKKIYNERPPPAHTSLHASNPITKVASVASETVQQVTPRSGIANFFRGFTPTLIGMVPYAGLSFLTHDTVGDLLRHPSISEYTTIPNTQGHGSDPLKPAQLKYWAELTSGGTAGFVSQAASYPFEVIRRRMQVGGVVGDGHRLGMSEVAQRIWMERGWRGFFVGLSIGYVKVIPMTATGFLVYERCKYMMGI